MDVDRTAWGSTLVKNHDENKTYILVKLSESFSNAIQEYSAPRIKFHGSRGAIKFPNGKSYDFSLAQSDNPVECIRQTKNRWESVGKTTCCLHIKGKDDVYQRTRTKMEAAEQEKRKYCTKLLGSPDSGTSASSTTATSRNLSNNVANNSSATINNYTTTTSTSATTTNSTVDCKPMIATTTTSAHTDTSNTITSNGNSNNNNNTNNNNYSYQSKYPDITDIRQLKRYKAEFDKDFKEYRHLHGYLLRVQDIFRRLKETVDQLPEGSPEWEAARNAIFRESERRKGDSNFIKSRDKYKNVIRKLTHIKAKIWQFKREHRDNARKRRKREAI